MQVWGRACVECLSTDAGLPVAPQSRVSVVRETFLISNGVRPEEDRIP